MELEPKDFLKINRFDRNLLNQASRIALLSKRTLVRGALILSLLTFPGSASQANAKEPVSGSTDLASLLIPPSDGALLQIKVQHTSDEPHTPSLDQSEPEQSNEFSWPVLHDLVDRIKQISPEEEYPFWDQKKADLEFLERAYQPVIDWADRLIQLTEEREQDPIKPSLKKLYKQRLGGIDPKHISVEEIIPFYQYRAYLLGSFRLVEGLARDIYELETFGNYDQARDKFKLLDQHIQEQKIIFQPLYETPETGQCFDQVNFKPVKSVVLTEQGELKITAMEPEEMTDQQRANFGKGIEIINQLIDSYYYVRRLCINIWMFDPDYGSFEKSLPEHISAMFFARRSFHNEFGNALMFMDKFSNPDERLQAELDFYHEVFKHAGDPNANPNLMFSLRPEDYIDLSIHQLQVMQNPDYANITFDIPTLFAPRPLKARDKKFIREADNISTSDFVGAYTEYPRNVLAKNFYNIHMLPSLEKYYRYSGSHYDRLNWAVRRYSIESDEVRQNITLAFEKLAQDELNFSHARGGHIDGNEQFDSWDQFVNRIRPELVYFASRGSLKARVTLWGLERFQKEFANFEFIRPYLNPKDQEAGKTPDRPTSRNKSTSAYLNYLETVNYLTLAHAVYHNDSEVRLWFPRPIWRGLARHFYLSSEKAEQEGLAEGGALAFYWGDRLVEKPPFIGLQEHLAYKLLTN